ncbi:hypothetical protein GWK41_05695 [Persephonella atlantica]|uniref:Uncharacterized protein n=1 Tax=Persephonella atlantica TaxID=2699429 RepID=A0ABS1GHY5_9AQUI|nr:hypothetical protein [Persephonella atlantica]MBK3332553.1 hypothetical protein [Persephonella atlantica]
MEIKIEKPEDVIPIMKEYSLPDGLPLYKELKGYTVLETVQPGKVGNVLFILAKKVENGRVSYKIIRYFKTFGDVGVDADFTPENIDEAVRVVFNTLSKHIM